MYLNFDPATANTLLALKSLNTQLTQTEAVLSSGNSVNSAADNPIVWAQAQSANTIAAGWGAAASEISVGSSELTTATSALSTVQTTLNSMQTALTNYSAVLAANSSADPTTTLSELQQYSETLLATVAGAVSSSGVNLLDGSTSGSASVVDGYTPGGTVRTTSFTTQAVTGSSSILQTGTGTDFTNITTTNLATTTSIGTVLTNLKTVIANVNNYSSSLGAVSSSETTMQDYATTMQTNAQNYASNLTAADMSTASARESALQTQIQLATQVLSIANQHNQLILKLL